MSCHAVAHHTHTPSQKILFPLIHKLPPPRFFILSIFLLLIVYIWSVLHKSEGFSQSVNISFLSPCENELRCHLIALHLPLTLRCIINTEGLHAWTPKFLSWVIKQTWKGLDWWISSMSRGKMKHTLKRTPCQEWKSPAHVGVLSVSPVKLVLYQRLKIISNNTKNPEPWQGNSLSG